jgi:hypothetical protein
MLDIVGLLIVGATIGLVGLLIHCQLADQPRRTTRD